MKKQQQAQIVYQPTFDSLLLLYYNKCVPSCNVHVKKIILKKAMLFLLLNLRVIFFSSAAAAAAFFVADVFHKFFVVLFCVVFSSIHTDGCRDVFVIDERQRMIKNNIEWKWQMVLERFNGISSNKHSVFVHSSIHWIFFSPLFHLWLFLCYFFTTSNFPMYCMGEEIHKAVQRLAHIQPHQMHITAYQTFSLFYFATTCLWRMTKNNTIFFWKKK